jgi:tubulin monoglycylase TTLL3/8
MNQQIRIWMYKNSYLRFSSQEFSLEKLSESIHLTNHAVQKKYTNDGERDLRLPTQNMWTLLEFQKYLSTIEKAGVWDEKIYPGMTKNIRAIIIASLDETEFDRNTFQLYGADFMIDEDFEPVLIEINASPDLNPSTDVTKQICADVLEDTIKGCSG